MAGQALPPANRFLLDTRLRLPERSASASHRNSVSICRQRFIGSQQNQFLHMRLRHQHPIERAVVAPPKQRDLPGVGSHQWQAFEGLAGRPPGEAGRQPQLAQALLEPDLPERDGADEYGVPPVADRLSGVGGEGRTVLPPRPPTTGRRLGGWPEFSRQLCVGPERFLWDLPAGSVDQAILFNPAGKPISSTSFQFFHTYYLGLAAEE